MRFKLTTVNVNATVSDTPETRNSRLTFVEVRPPSDQMAMMGDSSINILTTQKEAAVYELGNEYELSMAVVK